MIICDDSCNAPDPIEPVAVDGDLDGVADCNDNCPLIANADQDDSDEDLV